MTSSNVKEFAEVYNVFADIYNAPRMVPNAATCRSTLETFVMDDALVTTRTRLAERGGDWEKINDREFNSVERLMRQSLHYSVERTPEVREAFLDMLTVGAMYGTGKRAHKCPFVFVNKLISTAYDGADNLEDLLFGVYDVGALFPIRQEIVSRAAIDSKMIGATRGPDGADYPRPVDLTQTLSGKEPAVSSEAYCEWEIDSQKFPKGFLDRIWEESAIA